MAGLIVHMPPRDAREPAFIVQPKDNYFQRIQINEDETKDGFLTDVQVAMIVAWVRLLKGTGEQVGQDLVGRVVSRTGDHIWNKVKRYINGFLPPVPGEVESKMFEIMYSAKSFTDGIDEIAKKWPERSPLEIMEIAFEFPFRYNRRNPFAKLNPNSPNIVISEHVLYLSRKYNVDIPAILERAELAHERVGWGKPGIWNDIHKAILDANIEAVTSPNVSQQLAQELSETQELFLEQLRLDRLQKELSAIREVLDYTKQVLETSTQLNGVVDKVVLWNKFTVDLGPEVVGENVGRFTLVKKIEDLITKIDNNVPMTEAERGFITRLLEKNPPLQKIVDSKTHYSNTAISGTNLALDMMRQVQKGTNTWFGQILMEMVGYTESVSAGIVVYDKNGQEIARYELNYNVKHAGTKNSIELYVEGDPSPVSPYSFKKGRVFIIRGDSTTIEDAIQITDGRNRKFYVTKQDMEKFDRMAADLYNDPAVRNSQAGRAFLRFYNSLQAVAKMVYGDAYEITPNSPEKAIVKTSVNLARENWAAELEQSLDRLGREFANLQDVEKRYVENGATTKDAPKEEAVKNMVQTEVDNFAKRFLPMFGEKARPQFKESLRKLKAAIIDGNAAARHLAIAEIKAEVARQIHGQRQADRLSTDLWAETKEWLKAKPLKEYADGAEPSAELREFIIARGVETTLPPSLERARNYASVMSFDRAIMEYERIVADRETPVGDKIIALAEEANLALSMPRPQLPRARRAVARIRWFEANGAGIPSGVRMVMDSVDSMPINGNSATVTKTAARPTVFDNALEETEVEQPVWRQNFAKGYGYAESFAYKVGGPALFGAATFMVSRELAEMVLPQPETQLEAMLMGYDIMIPSIVLDHAARRGAEYIVWRGVNPHAVIAPFTWGGFFGNLGTSAVVFKTVYKGAKSFGADDETAEITGLVGTGVLYSAWQPFLRWLLSEETAKRAIAAAERGITKGGLAYLIAYMAPTVAEVAYNIYDKPVSVMAREEWYQARTRQIQSRSLFGNAKDVPWYEQIGATVYGFADDLLVPPSWHKLTAETFDGVAREWIENCETMLMQGYETCL